LHRFLHNFVHVYAQIAHATTRRLSDVKGISEAKVLKLKEIVKQLVSMEFKTAADALEDRQSIAMLTTGWRHRNRIHH
jgi:hypothetical protein